MKRHKNQLHKPLIAASLVGALLSFSTGSVSAQIDGYVTKGKSATGTDTFYYYDTNNLLNSYREYLIDEKTNEAQLWARFIKSNQIVALHDTASGYVDYADVKRMYTPSFDIQNYIEKKAPLFKPLRTNPSLTEVYLGPNNLIRETPKTAYGSWSIGVQNASIINEKTLQVILDQESDTTITPNPSNFNVKVLDGEVMPVSSIAMIGNDKLRFNLTIPSLSGKEGSLSVNGGLSIPYDFKKPSVVSVRTSADKIPSGKNQLKDNQIELSFSEKVSQQTAEYLPNYKIYKQNGSLLNGAASVMPTGAELQNDGKSVILTTDGSMTNKTADYRVSVVSSTNPITDIKGNIINFTTLTFKGVGEAPDTVAPRLDTAQLDKMNGTLTLIFSKPVEIRYADMIQIIGSGISQSLRDDQLSSPQFSENNTVIFKLDQDFIDKLNASPKSGLSIRIQKNNGSKVAIMDKAGNSAAKTSDLNRTLAVSGDTTPPTLSSAIFTYNNENDETLLTLSFDEDVYIKNPAMIEILEDDSSLFTLRPELLQQTGSNSKFEYKLDSSAIQKLNGTNPSKLYVKVQADTSTKQAIIDKSGNSLASSTTPVTIPARWSTN